VFALIAAALWAWAARRERSSTLDRPV